MSAKKIVRWVVVGLCLVFTLGLLGAYLYFSNLPPEGELVLMSPGEAATVKVDGGDPIELGVKVKRTLELPAGKHEIEILQPVARTLEVEVLDRKTVIVPLAQPQCYATYDVTNSAYEGSTMPPLFLDTQVVDEPFPLPYATYLSLDDLPDERSSGQTVKLLVTGTCDEIAALTSAHR